jgi:hypothetical protein
MYPASDEHGVYKHILVWNWYFMPNLYTENTIT